MFYEFFTENQTENFRNFVEVPDGTKFSEACLTIEKELALYLGDEKVTEVQDVSESEFSKIMESFSIESFCKTDHNAIFQVAFENGKKQIFLYTTNAPKFSKKHVLKFLQKGYCICYGFDEISEVSKTIDWSLKREWSVQIS